MDVAWTVVPEQLDSGKTGNRGVRTGWRGACGLASLSLELVYIDIFVKVRRLGRSLLPFSLCPLLCPFLRQLFLQLLTPLFDCGR